MTRRFDVVIIGGGSAGCVLASRLSEDPGRTVALVEAGPDTPPNHTDQVIWDSYPIVAYFDPRHHWRELRVYHQPPPESGPDTRTRRRYEQARVMGGGSSINGMMANRGSPDDYDGWAAEGATGWSWEEVLPFFRKLERDADCKGAMHGSDGPLPLRRVGLDEWPGFSRAAAQALEASGLPYTACQHEDFDPAWFPIVINNDGERRASTAAAYLTAQVRSRPNLVVFPDTQALRITFDGKRATGVDVRILGGIGEHLQAGEVVVAAGALHTPALLQRSGIGDGSLLQRVGVDVVADRPGVGRNLQEHPQIAVSSLLDPAARQPWSLRRHIFGGFRYSSGIDGCDPVDMYGVIVNRSGWHPLGQKLGGFLVWVNRAYSQGWVEIESANPLSEPRVELNLLSDDRDRLRLQDALVRLAALYRHPEMQKAAHYPFPTSYTEKSRDLAVVTRGNRVRTEPWARLADAPASVRRRVVERKISGGLSLFDLIRDEQALEAFIRERSHGTWHCCGTARMGRESDPGAVTDPTGKVYGVEGLRIGDASLMPFVPRANTNLPAIMIGEKIAAAIAGQQGS
ncbi:MAG: GMC family oxidoreductase N-terminal domain-containing protein [Thermomicrobiales bacterium]|jgi:5-(hydroxymethyl)furfural/furfural oxidase|nr:GMC family oxidoreductase N-terminal domain-containing protein [Thermomicrobiales bacterium]